METYEQAKNTFSELYEMLSSRVCNVIGGNYEAKH